jgi:DNA-binding MarR family transcriptional regulator
MEDGVLVVTQGSGMIADLQHSTLDVIQKFLVLYRYIRHYARKTHCEGIRGRELSTLRYLNEAGPLTIGQITQYLFLSASSASELVSRMEEAGYVLRRRSTEDSRVVFVELTAKGKQLAEETPLGGIPLLRERIKALPPEQLLLIDEALSSLIDIMEINPNEF